METFKLTKPVMLDGEKKSAITYDLEALTGEDIDNAVRSLKKTGVQVTAVELDPSYHAAVFAQAAGLELQDVKRMCAKDYNRAIVVVRDFFLTDSEESSQEILSDK